MHKNTEDCRPDCTDCTKTQVDSASACERLAHMPVEGGAVERAVSDDAPLIRLIRCNCVSGKQVALRRCYCCHCWFVVGLLLVYCWFVVVSITHIYIYIYTQRSASQHVSAWARGSRTVDGRNFASGADVLASCDVMQHPCYGAPHPQVQC